MLQALAHQARGDLPAALAPLERALTLAEPEGYVRIFVDEGPPHGGPAGSGREQRDRRATTSAGCWRPSATVRATARPPDRHLVEPLSERELDVLRLLATDLDGPDIARELVVSLNTVRTHTKNIYAKLGVNNRRAAVRRAEELDLLSRARPSQPRPIVVPDL